MPTDMQLDCKVTGKYVLMQGNRDIIIVILFCDI